MFNSLECQDNLMICMCLDHCRLSKKVVTFLLQLISPLKEPYLSPNFTMHDSNGNARSKDAAILPKIWNNWIFVFSQICSVLTLDGSPFLSTAEI
jgi:hypothetical protein